MNENEEYLKFAIKGYRKSMNDKDNIVNVGYEEHELVGRVEFRLPLNCWSPFVDLMLEFAIENELYEYCKLIKELKIEVDEYVENYDL